MSAIAAGSERLKVVFLMDVLGLAGGAERFARELAVQLDGERFERTFCFSRWSDAEARTDAGAAAIAELEAGGVRVLSLRRRSALSLWAWRPLLRLLREQRVDILHAHKVGSNVWGSLLGPLAGVPVVVAHEQTWSYEGQPIRRLLDRELIARRSTAFICVSREDRRRMIEIEGIDPEKIVLVSNAIPPLAPPRHSVRQELGIAEDDPVIGAVCVLRSQKALDVLLRAGALLREQSPRLRILIAGHGPELDQLQALSGSLGIADAVDFLGRRDDVPELLDALDVAVLSSDYEGTPLAVIEYMAAGLPVVATRVGGLPDLIDDGVEGRLVSRRDPSALASAIAGLLADRPLARAMGERARERQRREFDIRAAAANVAGLYERLYAASPRAGAARASR